MKRALVLSSALVVALAACGDDAPVTSPRVSTVAPADGVRTIEVAMVDLAFSPDGVEVARGETVRFVFRNDGAVRHEALVGGMDEQTAHHADMAATAGGDEMHHGSGHGASGDAGGPGDMPSGGMHVVTAEPGETVELTHTFDTAGSTVIGCHQPGHWEAGMMMAIDVI